MEFYWTEWMSPWWVAAIICLLIISYLMSKTVAFYIKYYFYLVSFSLVAIVTFPLMLFNPGCPRNIRILRYFSRWVQAPLTGIRTTVLKERSYPEEPSFIIVCNHQSALDSLAMMEIFPENCILIVKKSWQNASPFGLAAVLSGEIFIDRGRANNKMDVLQKLADTIHKKKYRVWFFPESARKLSTKKKVTKTFLPFEKCAFKVAVLAKIPVVPVVFSSQEKFFNHADKVFKPGRIVASILPSISTRHLTLDDVRQLTKKVRTIMIQEYNRINVDTKYSFTLPE